VFTPANDPAAKRARLAYNRLYFHDPELRMMPLQYQPRRERRDHDRVLVAVADYRPAKRIGIAMPEGSLS